MNKQLVRDLLHRATANCTESKAWVFEENLVRETVEEVLSLLPSMTFEETSLVLQHFGLLDTKTGVQSPNGKENTQ